MSATHRRPGGIDELDAAGGRRRNEPSPAGPGPEAVPAPAPVSGADPRLTARGMPVSGLLSLQRSAGNAAVTSLVTERPPVQRTVTIDEMEVVPSPPPTPEQEAAAYGTGEPVTSDGGTTTIHGASVSIEAAMTEAHGVLRADTIIADNVVASNYTPGAGNAW